MLALDTDGFSGSVAWNGSHSSLLLFCSLVSLQGESCSAEEFNRSCRREGAGVCLLTQEVQTPQSEALTCPPSSSPLPSSSCLSPPCTCPSLSLADTVAGDEEGRALGIVSLRQPEGEKQAGDQLQDESLDDPESEQGLAEDPHPLGSSSKAKRDTEEAAGAGILGRVRRAPEEGKKKKKDKKKNKEPKDPKATKKPKTDKKKKKDRQTTTTTTLPPTTTAIPTEPPIELRLHRLPFYPDVANTGHWKPDDYWDAEPTLIQVSSPDTPITDLPYYYWKPEEGDPAAL
ncbi:inactive carboxypeptidase-like protein X2 isoform X1 [Lates japonicus]|uniref:Inactive carboxypeptidase-like protein X2 isoform X1 n=1 Tax=Lates japonicus TaxID=270547 RepID=A0AAD3RG46_LATJO|nr:inactive carboxypeptidase-like protein X2 isoform X1 [Lates japonicus]